MFRDRIDGYVAVVDGEGLAVADAAQLRLGGVGREWLG